MQTTSTIMGEIYPLRYDPILECSIFRFTKRLMSANISHQFYFQKYKKGPGELYESLKGAQ